jgi:hypothetical protein
MGEGETTMDDERAEGLVISAELQLAYSSALGKLWRTDSAGTPIRELVIWHERKDRAEITINSVPIDGRRKVMTHAIWFIMHQRWPMSGHVIDHRAHPGTTRSTISGKPRSPRMP